VNYVDKICGDACDVTLMYIHTGQAWKICLATLHQHRKKNSKYVMISFLPDEDKFLCCMIDNFGIISQVEWREKDSQFKIKSRYFLSQNGKEYY
jgi:hypothetical protein